jgi:ABC-2 type transport system ATP-binding protein
MIRLDHVTKRYGSRTILHDISLEVQPGEIVGFLGPNGAGKTTTMRMIAGFTAATSGTVSVAGHDMATERELAAQKIGYLPEQPPLYDVLDVTGYLKFVARAKGVPRALEASRLDYVIHACRLEAVTKKEIYKLSKGYRQRVGLAQALLGEPEVLLLDEPTAGLDPGQIQETREVIRSVGQKHAVLLSTHILPEVTLICQRVAIINHGRILATGTPASLQQAAEATSSVLAEASGDPDRLHRALADTDGVRDVSVKPLPGREGLQIIECQVDAVDGVEARIARTLITSGELYKLERRQPTLENVFLRYISDSNSTDKNNNSPADTGAGPQDASEGALA